MKKTIVTWIQMLLVIPMYSQKEEKTGSTFHLATD